MYLFIVVSNEGGLVIIEPWRAFEVIDSGIQRPESKSSIVPIKMKESELIYEKEIAPCLSLHALEILRGAMDDEVIVRQIVLILVFYQFDNECN